jgi:hypothetical protein
MSDFRAVVAGAWFAPRRRAGELGVSLAAAARWFFALTSTHWMRFCRTNESTLTPSPKVDGENFDKRIIGIIVVENR